MNATPTNTLSSPLPLPASNGPSRPRPAHSASPVVPPLVFANNTTPTSSSGATPPSGLVRNRQNSENSDRNNNATPPTTPTRGLSIPPVGPPQLAIPNARRPSHQRCSPPVGARPTKQDLPPGAAPLGSIPRPPQPPSSNSSSQGISVPLLASQLGRPVNLGERGHHGQTPHGGPGGPVGLLGPGMPPLSPHHLNLLAHTLSPFAAIPMGNGKFMARNINGTLAVTSHPSNESELQIYRVLQRANLLSYYDTFIAQGGDDVQQLCEAGEAEFLEIMDLVGMASKPMHVRRLQKALQEWVQNPGLFQTPLVPLSNLSAPSAAAAVIRASTSASLGGPAGGGGCGINAPPINVPAQIPSGPLGSRPAVTNVNDPLSLISSSSNMQTSTTDRIVTAAMLRRSVSPPSSVIPMVLDKTAATSSAPHSPSPVGSSISKENPNSQQSGGVPSPTYSQGGQMDYPPLSSSPLQLTPSLVESQIQRIADTAENMIKAMANVEPKALKNNKKVSKEVEMQFQMVLGMSDDEPRKMEEIRRFSAIYGRFDCKRKPEKPLTLHEVSVNEAAAQLTFRKPILLMRRDELFPLARQVVRDSGYQYSKGHSRSQFQAGYPSKIFGLNNQGQEGQRGHGGDPHHHGGQGKSGDEENSRDSTNGDPQGQNKKRGRYSESEDPAGHHMVKKERYERIGEELRQLGDRMEELKQAAGQARDVNDGHRLHAIGQQLEIIQLRQNQLLQEQHHEQQRHLRPRVHGRVSTSSDPERPDTDEDSQLSYSNTSSPNHHMQTSSHGSYVLSASGGQIIAVQNPALSMSLPIRAPSTSPNQSSSSHQIHQDSKNLVNLLNLSRRGGLVNPASCAAARGDNSATAAANSGNGNQKQAVDNYNATFSQKKRELERATTIIHSDDEEMTFKQEPASPPPPPSAAISAHNSEVAAAHGVTGLLSRTNGK